MASMMAAAPAVPAPAAPGGTNPWGIQPKEKMPVAIEEDENVSDLQFLVLGMILGAVLCLMIQSCTSLVKRVYNSKTSGAENVGKIIAAQVFDTEDPNGHLQNHV